VGKYLLGKKFFSSLVVNKFPEDTCPLFFFSLTHIHTTILTLLDLYLFLSLFLLNYIYFTTTDYYYY